jgi:hypothetical protein
MENPYLLCITKCFFMKETNPPEQTLQDIKQMMERSSRFISLSGLSGITAGIFALAGAWQAGRILHNYYGSYNSRGFFTGDDFSQLKLKLIGLAFAVFVLAFTSSFYFTRRRARRQNVTLWGPVSKRLFWNMSVPLLAGAGFILGMLRYDDWNYVSSACLIFYGLGLINASKYTLTDIRYLGYCEIVLGLVNMFYIGYGLYFWAAGFGVLHIIYGAVMWWKYEKQ